ncbi:cytochrome P450 [Nemania sp. FL0916]|nr:cytochrome P450 [Nemania sp. FL0916]
MLSKDSPLLWALDQASWFDIALAVMFAAFIWYTVSSITAYNRLRHIPGPFLASFSDIWGFWIMTTSHNARMNIYGNVMRIGPRSVLTDNPEALMKRNSTPSKYHRGDWYHSLRMDWRSDNVLSELDTVKHDRRKAKLMSAFSSKRVPYIESKIDDWIMALTHTIQKKIEKGEGIMNIGLLLHYFQLDLITHCAIGTPWGDLADEQDHFDYLKNTRMLVPSLLAIGWLPFARGIYMSTWFMSLFGPKTTDKTGIGRFLGIVEKEVERRFSADNTDPDTGDDMLGQWIKHGLSPLECQTDLALLLPSGSETSVTTFKGILLLLMSSPVVYQRVKREIKNGIADGRISDPITNEEAKNLEYMQAVVREGFRFMSATNVGFVKRALVDDDVCGVRIPAGTDIFINYPAMMRTPEVFGEDAEVFQPDRFLGGGPNVERMIESVELMFGHGRFQCLGKVLVMMELNKMYVQVCTHYQDTCCSFIPWHNHSWACKEPLLTLFQQLLRHFDFEIKNPEQPWKRDGYGSYVITDFWAKVSVDMDMINT